MNIQTMVNRFLGWTLPTDFSPDAGISFKPSEWVHAWPTGTNLFTAEQATAMFEYVLAHDIEDAERASEPIPMVLHCPSCGLQHIDAPDAPGDAHAHSDGHESRWNNPPHRSHLCHGCRTIWRPADVPTVGVESIQTRGKADKIIHAERASVPAKTEMDYEYDEADEQ